ncbi:MAG: hypothetical protein MRY32_04460 [Rickettsiales bacterium]|nr:hypothetical protein [Rickettsiales bacterium]
MELLNRLPNTTSEMLEAMGVDLTKMREEAGDEVAFQHRIRMLPQTHYANRMLMAIHLRRQARGDSVEMMEFEFFHPNDHDNADYIAARDAAYLTQQWRDETNKYGTIEARGQ